MYKGEFSLIEMFGSVPVDPDVFKEKLRPKVKWFYKCKEGGGFCTNCGTLTCDIPKSHHPECCFYDDLDSYPISQNSIGLCPDCGDDLSIDSSREMRKSVISCYVCDFEFAGKCCEEALIKRFKKKYKQT